MLSNIIAQINNFLNFYFMKFYTQVTPVYDAASKHLSTKGIQGKDLLVFVFFGAVAVVFLVFLVFVYLKEKNRPRY